MESVKELEFTDVWDGRVIQHWGKTPKSFSGCAAEGCEVLGIVVPWKGAAASKCQRCLQRLRVQRGQSQICDKGRDLGVIIDTQTAQEKSKYCTIASSPTVNDKMTSLTRLTCIDQLRNSHTAHS